MIHRLNFGWGRSALRWLGVLGLLLTLGGCGKVYLADQADKQVTAPDAIEPSTKTISLTAYAASESIDQDVVLEATFSGGRKEAIRLPLKRGSKPSAPSSTSGASLGLLSVQMTTVDTGQVLGGLMKLQFNRASYEAAAASKGGSRVEAIEAYIVGGENSFVPLGQPSAFITFITRPAFRTPTFALTQIGTLVVSQAGAGQSITVAPPVHWSKPVIVYRPTNANSPPAEPEIDSLTATVRAVGSQTPIKTVEFTAIPNSLPSSVSLAEYIWAQTSDSAWVLPRDISGEVKGFRATTVLPGTGSYVVELAARRQGAVVHRASSMMNVVMALTPTAAISLPALANTRVGGTVQFDARASNIPQGFDFSYYAKKGGQPMPADAVIFASANTLTPVATINQAPDEVVIRIRYKNANGDWQTLEGTTGNIASRFLTGS